ncbi:unnamed protein product [Paramecium primaurelia]|uniref:Uncharacterized protein n=1 Tax=Paramecium primaurelia TaxID=5886 RepID=A0A8S1N1X1_PARPR|nr:unnamed protein product [Paramecium primaurelia]
MMKILFEQIEDLQEILATPKDIDKQVFNMIIEIFRKEKISDCLEFLQNDENHRHCGRKLLQVENLQIVDKELKLNLVRNNIKLITKALKKLKIMILIKMTIPLKNTLKLNRNQLRKQKKIR